MPMGKLAPEIAAANAGTAAALPASPGLMHSRDDPTLVDSGSDFLTMGDIVRAVGRGWRLMIIMVVGALAAAFAYLLLAEPKYDAVMVIAQSPDSAANQKLGASQALAQDLGLLSQVSDDSYARFQAGLTSPSLAQKIEADERLLRMMFDKRWDPESARWKERGAVGNFFYSLIGVTRQARPTEADILDYLNQHITLNQLDTNQLFEVHLTHNDPAVARELLAAITGLVDGLVRAAYLERAEAQSAYLTRALRDSTLSEQRQVLIQMLFAEEQKKMLGKVDLPFSLDVVSPAWVGDVPFSPKIAMSLVLAVVIGIVLAIVIIIFRQRGPSARQRLS